jgi:hypothetical protein
LGLSKSIAVSRSAFPVKKRYNAELLRGNWKRATGNLFMIVETIFSTISETGESNFAPMGIVWGGESVLVRPYGNTQTCRNLLSTGCGVANFSDDVLAYVQCGLYNAILPNFPAITMPGVVFQEACYWLELEVVSHSGSDERMEFQCRVLHKGRQRDFLGFCRADNAVIEAAIMATRLAFYSPEKVVDDLNHYIKVVEITGGDNEKQAIHLVQDYIRNREEQ